MERICKKCGETKPIEEFAKCKRCKYGYSFTCEICTKEFLKEYYQNNIEHLKTCMRRYRQNNKEHRKEYFKEYHKNNKEFIKECNKNMIDTVSDRYVYGILHNHYSLPTQTLKQHPELIEKYRKRIILKRSLKSLKNESITNS